MRLKILFISTLVIFGLSSFYKPVESENNTSLCLNFGNIKSNDGNLIIFLYQFENQFPRNPYKHYYIKKIEMKNNQFKIDDLKKGYYAISAIDDENSNNILDFSWGIPKEGYSFSNIPEGMSILRLPTFKKCAFNCQNTKTSINLNFQY